MTKNQHLLLAIKIIGGSGADLARCLGVRRAAVSNAVCGRMPVPKSWCPVIELETKGQVKCEDLLPGIDWSIFRNLPKTKETHPEQQCWILKNCCVGKKKRKQALSCNYFSKNFPRITN